MTEVLPLAKDFPASIEIGRGAAVIALLQQGDFEFAHAYVPFTRRLPAAASSCSAGCRFARSEGDRVSQLLDDLDAL